MTPRMLAACAILSTACAAAPVPPPAAAASRPQTGEAAAQPDDAAKTTRFDCGDKAIGVRMDGKVLVLDMDGVSHRLKPVKAASGARYGGQGPGEMGRIEFWNKGHEATLTIGGKAFPPCTEQGPVEPVTGPEAPSKLAATEWMVELLGDEEVEDDEQQPTLDFDKQGGLSGTTSCNRYSAGVTIEGDTIRVSPARVTRMACETELMRQEQTFLDLIGAASTFEIRADGWLVLTTRDGRKLAARPREPEAVRK